MIHFCANIYMLRLTFALFIAIKPNSKENIHTPHPRDFYTEYSTQCGTHASRQLIDSVCLLTFRSPRTLIH